MTASHHEHIANTLTKEILSGLYRPGDRVPSERDLAARFEVSRGAAREALQRLDQLGVLVVQPGGARVAPVDEASLDVIGHLLDLEDLPPVDLVDEILQVVKGLISLATERAVQRGSPEEIESITALLSRLIQAADAEREDVVTRFELLRALMEASGNLVTRLIARALLSELGSRVSKVISVDEQAPLHGAYRDELVKFRAALVERDATQAKEAVEALSDLNRDALLNVLQDAHERQTTPVQQANV